MKQIFFGILVVLVIVNLFKEHLKKKRNAYYKKQFEQGMRDGKYAIKTFGFDTADSMARKTKDGYRDGMMHTIRMMECKAHHRTLKKRQTS